MNELVKSIKPLIKVVFGDIKDSFGMCLKTENCYIKIFVEISEKVWENVWNFV